jgi:hypothetical protein
LCRLANGGDKSCGVTCVTATCWLGHGRFEFLPCDLSAPPKCKLCQKSGLFWGCFDGVLSAILYTFDFWGGQQRVGLCRRTLWVAGLGLAWGVLAQRRTPGVRSARFSHWSVDQAAARGDGWEWWGQLGRFGGWFRGRVGRRQSGCTGWPVTQVSGRVGAVCVGGGFSRCG